MNKLEKLGIVVGKDNVAALIFQSFCPDFQKISYQSPSEYVRLLWDEYQNVATEAMG